MSLTIFTWRNVRKCSKSKNVRKLFENFCESFRKLFEKNAPKISPKIDEKSVPIIGQKLNENSLKKLI